MAYVKEQPWDAEYIASLDGAYAEQGALLGRLQVNTMSYVVLPDARHNYANLPVRVWSSRPKDSLRYMRLSSKIRLLTKNEYERRVVVAKAEANDIECALAAKGANQLVGVFLSIEPLVRDSIAKREVLVFYSANPVTRKAIHMLAGYYNLEHFSFDSAEAPRSFKKVSSCHPACCDAYRLDPIPLRAVQLRVVADDYTPPALTLLQKKRVKQGAPKPRDALAGLREASPAPPPPEFPWDLPFDVLAVIFHHLDLPGIFSVSLVCLGWSRVVSESAFLWRALILRLGAPGSCDLDSLQGVSQLKEAAREALAQRSTFCRLHGSVILHKHFEKPLFVVPKTPTGC